MQCRRHITVTLVRRLLTTARLSHFSKIQHVFTTDPHVSGCLADIAICHTTNNAPTYNHNSRVNSPVQTRSRRVCIHVGASCTEPLNSSHTLRVRHRQRWRRRRRFIASVIATIQISQHHLILHLHD